MILQYFSITSKVIHTYFFIKKPFSTHNKLKYQQNNIFFIHVIMTLCIPKTHSSIAFFIRIQWHCISTCTQNSKYICKIN